MVVFGSMTVSSTTVNAAATNGFVAISDSRL